MIKTAQIGDTLELFDGWVHSVGRVVHIIEDRYSRGIITQDAENPRQFTRWDGPFPTWTVQADSLQEAWDIAYPAQAPRNCTQCGCSFRPRWIGPGSAVLCEVCNPPRRQEPYARATCHYCGMPAVELGFFDEPVCKDCGG